MLTYKNHSDALIVVLHEIYGINGHIAGVCKDLADSGFDVLCPDLLDGKPAFDYGRQEDAYWYFMNYIGFEPAAKRVTFLIRQEESEYRHIFLLGFSIGATIAWLCGGDAAAAGEGFHCGGNLIRCDGIIGYYGSRIRDYTDVTPKCPTLLIYAEEEDAFDPVELQKEVAGKEKAEVHILKGKHGFADPFSSNFNEASAKEAERIRKEFLKRIGDR
jgi:dienelactone hydrolase